MTALTLVDFLRARLDEDAADVERLMRYWQ